MYDLPAFIADSVLFPEFRACLRDGNPPARIREVKIKLTSRCNLRCAFCNIWRLEKTAELTTAEVLQVIDDLAALDCRKIHFSGGEPTLRDDLPRLIAQAARCGIKVTLTTNGTRLTADLAESLLRAGLANIALSLDSADPDIHDGLRGVKGAFKRTVAGLKALRRVKRQVKAKTKVRLNMVLTRKNYHQYPDVLALAGELGVTEVTPLPVDEKRDRENRLLPWQLVEYNETIAPAVADLRAQYGFSTAPALVYPFGQEKTALKGAAAAEYSRGYYRDHPCYVPWLTALIAWDGNVWPCCMTRGRGEPLGNVREQSFRDIFLGPRYTAIRHAFTKKRLSVCRRCDDFLAENRFLEAAIKKLQSE